MQTISSNALLDSAGVATPVSVIATPVGLDNESNSAAGTPGALFGDYIFNHSAGNNSNVTVTIGGMFPGHTYNLYLYTGQTLSVTDGTPVAFTPTGIFNYGNTQEFSVTPTSGSIVVTLGAGWLMAQAGLQKGALESRRQRRNCPSCGRRIETRVCASCAG